MEELASLPGIGKITALRIVRYRRENGPFKSLDELLLVPRVSRRVINQIRGLAYVEKIPEIEVPKAEEELEIVPPEEPEPPVPEKGFVPLPPPEKPVHEFPLLQININEAGLKELKRAGFSTRQAKNIIRFRSRYGDFKGVDDLDRVPGITRAMLDRVRERLYVK